MQSAFADQKKLQHERLFDNNVLLLAEERPSAAFCNTRKKRRPSAAIFARSGYTYFDNQILKFDWKRFVKAKVTEEIHSFL